MKTTTAFVLATVLFAAAVHAQLFTPECTEAFVAFGTTANNNATCPQVSNPTNTSQFETICNNDCLTTIEPLFANVTAQCNTTLVPDLGNLATATQLFEVRQLTCTKSGSDFCVPIVKARAEAFNGAAVVIQDSDVANPSLSNFTADLCTECTVALTAKLLTLPDLMLPAIAQASDLILTRDVLANISAACTQYLATNNGTNNTSNAMPFATKEGFAKSTLLVSVLALFYTMFF